MFFLINFAKLFVFFEDNYKAGSLAQLNETARSVLNAWRYLQNYGNLFIKIKTQGEGYFLLAPPKFLNTSKTHTHTSPQERIPPPWLNQMKLPEIF